MTAPAGPPSVPQSDPASRQRLFWALASLVIVWPLLVAAEFKPWIFLQPDNLKPALRFLADFFPPKLEAEFLLMVVKETWRTVAIATAGVAMAMLLAVPLALVCARTLSVSALTGNMSFIPAVLRRLARWLLIILRSVPELIWALVFVRVVGLGPTAGVLAIAITYGGMLGKVYAEILESTDAQSSQALLRNGNSRLQTFLYAVMPQCSAELTSYTLYRWECAIRSSAVLGFVGAGGLGQQMDSSMKMFAGSEIATMLLVFIFLVWLADLVSGMLRKALA